MSAGRFRKESRKRTPHYISEGSRTPSGSTKPLKNTREELGSGKTATNDHAGKDPETTGKTLVGRDTDDRFGLYSLASGIERSIEEGLASLGKNQEKLNPSFIFEGAQTPGGSADNPKGTAEEVGSGKAELDNHSKSPMREAAPDEHGKSGSQPPSSTTEPSDSGIDLVNFGLMGV